MEKCQNSTFSQEEEWWWITASILGSYKKEKITRDFEGRIQRTKNKIWWLRIDVFDIQWNTLIPAQQAFLYEELSSHSGHMKIETKVSATSMFCCRPNIYATRLCDCPALQNGCHPGHVNPTKNRLSKNLRSCQKSRVVLPPLHEMDSLCNRVLIKYMTVDDWLRLSLGQLPNERGCNIHEVVKFKTVVLRWGFAV